MRNQQPLAGLLAIEMGKAREAGAKRGRRWDLPAKNGGDRQTAQSRGWLAFAHPSSRPNRTGLSPHPTSLYR